MQRIWRDIELRDPNPMKYSEDIANWNTKRAKTKLYKILHGVNDEFDQDKRDILRENTLPEVKTSYTTIQWERDRRQVMGTRNRYTKPTITPPETGIRSDLLAKASFPVKSFRSDETDSSIRHATRPQSTAGRGRLSSHSGDDQKNVWCSHCGKLHHNRAECFQLIGFPEGWRSQRKDEISTTNTTTIMIEGEGGSEEELGFSVPTATRRGAAKERTEELGFAGASAAKRVTTR